MSKHEEVDSLLKGLFKHVGLRELFKRRIYELKLSQNAAEKMLQIGHKPLIGLLDGTQKKVDYIVLSKVAVFLGLGVEEVIDIHLRQLESNFELQNTTANKKKFIKDNFDLISLRKAGVIDTINDFNEIENKIKASLSLNSIFDYKKRAFVTAFWAHSITTSNASKNAALTRDYWLTRARNILLKIDNYNYYDRENLIKYFPQIRWHSTNVELGLVHVIKVLYRLGVTVIVLPKLSSLHLRGATLIVNEKPCIVLTDYSGFYPTIWHGLIHELYHVLFDLDELKSLQYLISEDTEQTLTLDEGENEADNFARRYIFSEDQSRSVEKHIRSDSYIREVARENNIHPSIIHSYYAHDHGKDDRLAWIRARRYMPNTRIALDRLEFPFKDEVSLELTVIEKKIEIYY